MEDFDIGDPERRWEVTPLDEPVTDPIPVPSQPEYEPA